MSKPVSNNVDMTLLLSSLQTLTNKVNALQTAAAKTSKPTANPSKINSLDDRFLDIESTSEYDRTREAMIARNNFLSLEYQVNKFVIPWDEVDKAKSLIFESKLNTYLAKFKQSPENSLTSLSSINFLNSKLPVRNYFTDICSNYMTDADGTQNVMWNILKTMPKGGMLHIHSGAICDLPWIINTGVSSIWKKDVNGKADPTGADQIICVNKDMFDDPYYYNRDAVAASFFFKFKAPEANHIVTIAGVPVESSSTPLVGGPTYTWGNQYYNLNHASSKTPEFKAKLTKLLYMVGTDADDRNSLSRKDMPYVWNAFDTVISGRYSSLRKAGMQFTDELFRQGLKTLYNDGVRHIDVRFGFGPVYANANLSIQEGNCIREMNSTMQKIDQLERVKPISGTLGVIGTGDFTLNHIIAPPRLNSVGPNTAVPMTRHLECGFQLISGKYRRADGTEVALDATIRNTPVAVVDPAADPAAPKLINYWRRTLANNITGYDLIADEDRTQKQSVFKDAWVNTSSLANRYGVADPSFNYYMHSGESDWLSNENVIDAVLLGAKRLGHGFNIALRPGILAEAKAKNVCLEICPISNQMLLYTPDLRAHFANILFRSGMPICLSSDDPAMYGYSGMTYDYWAAVVAWGLTFRQLKNIVWNGIIYSSLRYAKKVKMLSELNAQWNTWRATIV